MFADILAQALGHAGGMLQGISIGLDCSHRHFVIVLVCSSALQSRAVPSDSSGNDVTVRSAVVIAKADSNAQYLVSRSLQYLVSKSLQYLLSKCANLNQSSSTSSITQSFCTCTVFVLELVIA